MIPIEFEGQRVFVPIPEDALSPYTLRLKLDVGPSSTWSEVQTLQTLDNLLKAGKLTMKQYLERIPDGHIPKKAELLAEMEEAESAQKGGAAGDAGGMSAMMAKMQGGMAAPNPKSAANAAGGQSVPQQAVPNPQAATQSVQNPQAGSAMGGAEALMALIREEAQAGMVKPEVVKAVEAMAAQGAPTQAIVGALAQAASQGQADKAFASEILAQFGGQAA